jgi:hypothetical protein
VNDPCEPGDASGIVVRADAHDHDARERRSEGAKRGRHVGSVPADRGRGVNRPAAEVAVEVEVGPHRERIAVVEDVSRPRDAGGKGRRERDQDGGENRKQTTGP